MTKYIFVFIAVFSATIGMLPIKAKDPAKTVKIAPAKLDIRPEAKAMRDAVAQTCQSCHVGQGKNVKKFGDFFEDGVLQKFVDRRDPKNSILYKKIASKEMPKDDNGDELDDDDREEFLQTIEKWIVAGTPSLEGNKEIDFVSPKEILETIAADIKLVPAAEIRDVRYFSFLSIYNHSRRRANLPLFTQALSKLVNSMSWLPKIVVPKQIDNRGIVFRINLKDYGWNDNKWDQVMRVYPHTSEFNSFKALNEEIIRATNERIPVVRGDWFIFETSRPPFYHVMLDMPGIDRTLELNLLQLNVNDNILNAKVDRAGFVDSGVSQNNRIIERHTTKFGAYWKSYDFATSISDKNIMERPLGPILSREDSAAGARPFDHDGGEIIYNLPNGLQAYLLVNDVGNRIDQGPIQIVSDPSRPDRLVTNGVSCMGCHNRGIILKADQINDAFSSTPSPLSERVRKFYGNPQFLNLMEKDQEVFLAAQGLAKVTQVSPEVVSTAVAIYEGTIDRQGLAVELNLTKTELDGFIIEAGAVSETVKSFFRQTANSTIKRDTFDRFVQNDLANVLANAERKKISDTQVRIQKETRDSGGDLSLAADRVVKNQMSEELYINLRKNGFGAGDSLRLATKGAVGDQALKIKKDHANAGVTSIVFFVEKTENGANKDADLERFLKLSLKVSADEALEISARKDVDVEKYIELRSNNFNKDETIKIIASKKFVAGTFTQLQKLGVRRETALELAAETERAVLAIEIIAFDQNSRDDILALSKLALDSQIDVKTYASLRKVVGLVEAKAAAILIQKKEISLDKYLEFRKLLNHEEIVKVLKNDKFVIGTFSALRSKGVAYEVAFALAQDPKLAASALEYLNLGNRVEGDLFEISKLVSEGSTSADLIGRLKKFSNADESREAALKITKKEISEVDYSNVRSSGLGHKGTLDLLQKAANGKSDVSLYLRMRKTGFVNEVESQEVAELVTGKQLTEENYLSLRGLNIDHKNTLEFGKTKEGIDAVQFIAKGVPDRGDDIVQTALLWGKKELDITKYLTIRNSAGVASSKEARDAATQVEKQAINQEFYQGLRKQGFNHPDALYLSASDFLNTAANKLKLENIDLAPDSIRFLVDKINGGAQFNLPKFTWIMKASPSFNKETAIIISASTADEDPIFRDFLINLGMELEDIATVLREKKFLDVYQREMLKTRKFSLEEIIRLSEDVRGVKFLEDVKEVDRRAGAEDAVRVAIAAGRKELDIDTYGDLLEPFDRQEAFEVSKLIKSKKVNKSNYLKLRKSRISQKEALTISLSGNATSNTLSIESDTSDNINKAAEVALLVESGQLDASTYIKFRKNFGQIESAEAAKLVKTKAIDENSYLKLRDIGLSHNDSITHAKDAKLSALIVKIDDKTRDGKNIAVFVGQAISRGELDLDTYLKIHNEVSQSQAFEAAKLVKQGALDVDSYIKLRDKGLSHNRALIAGKNSSITKSALKIESDTQDNIEKASDVALEAANGDFSISTYILFRKNSAATSDAVAAAKLVKSGSIDESSYAKLRDNGLRHDRAVEAAQDPKVAADALKIEDKTQDNIFAAVEVAFQAKKFNFSASAYIELRKEFASSTALAKLTKGSK